MRRSHRGKARSRSRRHGPRSCRRRRSSVRAGHSGYVVRGQDTSPDETDRSSSTVASNFAQLCSITIKCGAVPGSCSSVQSQVARRYGKSRNEPSDQKLLTRADVQEEYGIGKRFLEVAATRREGPPFIKIGRSVRYLRKDLERWIFDQRVDTQGSAASR